MKLRKIIIFYLFILYLNNNIFANETVSVNLEITGININQGNIHVRIYSNAGDYRNDIPFLVIILESTANRIVHSFEIQEGEYLFALFQDTNNNGKLDTNFLGFPREPVGLSNYTSGIPRGFNHHKIPINRNSNRVTINMGRV